MATELLGSFEELVLLGVLRTDPEAYGMAVRRELETVGDREVAIGAVYATLDRLERKGLLRSRMGPATAERGGRRKRLYRITPDGAAAVREMQRIRARLGRPTLHPARA